MQVLVVGAIATASTTTSFSASPTNLCCGWHPETTTAATSIDAAALSHPPAVHFAIALKEHHQEQVQELALAVSTPTDPTYGQHLTRSQLDQLTAPLPTALPAVTAWLDEHHVTYHVSRDRYIKVENLSQSVATALLKAQFMTIVRGNKERRSFATHYELPAEISSHVAAVYGLAGVPLPVPLASNDRSTGVGTGGVHGVSLPQYGPPSVTPPMLQKTYNVTDSIPTGQTTKNKQAIVSFLGQVFSQTDIDSFYRNYVSNTTRAPTVTCVTSKGSTSGGCEGGAEPEASLDIQYLIGMNPTVATEAWYFNGQTLDFCGTVREWTQQLLAADDPPLVNSVSYGFQGNLGESGCTSSGILGVENDLAAIAARGLTVVFASGDDGNGQDPTNKLFPSWPGSSPWVTSVGATAFINYTLYGEEEGAHFTFASGGGFSWNMERLPNATYQDVAVKNYLNNAQRLPPSSEYHASGTGSPDVSALGQGYLVIEHGRAKPQGGSSAATPMFAGLISRLNEERMQKGMKPLGFLNPWMYANSDIFTDITVGWDSTNQSRDKSAFPCAKGWDPVTGLGTPNYGLMLESALKTGTPAKTTMG